MLVFLARSDFPVVSVKMKVHSQYKDSFKEYIPQASFSFFKKFNTEI